MVIGITFRPISNYVKVKSVHVAKLKSSFSKSSETFWSIIIVSNQHDCRPIHGFKLYHGK